MPLYEYQCQQCQRRTEKIQKFADAPLTVCPHCGGVLERTLTAPAVQFKGSGWYKDLYSSAKPAAKGGDAAASGTSGSSGDGAKASGGDSSSSAPAPSPAPAASPSTASSGTGSGGSSASGS